MTKLTVEELRTKIVESVENNEMFDIIITVAIWSVYVFIIAGDERRPFFSFSVRVTKNDLNNKKNTFTRIPYKTAAR